jgi:tRNA(Arg) A34 adenosine deaminase TadA
MCLGAIYWAHIDKMYFANTKVDAQNAGFDDSFIYEEINLKPEDRKLKLQQLLREEAIAAFETWKNTTNKTEY